MPDVFPGSNASDRTLFRDTKISLCDLKKDRRFRETPEGVFHGVVLNHWFSPA